MNADSRAQAREWLLKFSGGECAPAEQEAFRQWLEAGNANQQAFDEVQQLWGELDQVDEEMLAAHGDIPARQPRRQWALAASVMVTALFAALLWQWLATAPQAGAPSYSYYDTSTAELRELTLPDGSRVLLGADSRLGSNFGDERRELTLERGEAWFDVASDPARPFVVRAGTGSATAVGTAFSVHRGHQQVTVTVEEGLVAVRGDHLLETGDDKPLQAGQEISFNRRGKLGALATVAAGELGGWRQGRRVFRDTPLVELVADLNRYSAKPVVIDDAGLRQVTVSGVFNQFDDTDAVLHTIEQSSLARVVQRQGSIHLLQP